MKKFHKVDYVLGALIGIAVLLVATKVLALPNSPASDWFAYEKDRNCLAKNIYFEAGNQPFSGKLAVANVVLNRVTSKQFPDNVCEVIYQTKKYKPSWKTGKLIPVRGQCQFSWYCDGRPDNPVDSATWTEALTIAELALGSTIDLTDGALYYHADYSNPYWSDHLERLVQIETHIFYK
jgi:spore germination cell wall hydrolase CwlJ-like protein